MTGFLARLDRGLPVLEALPRLRAALAAGHDAVLAAPPGAGKTTAVPLALLDESWLGGGRILVLEPRRLAARAAASRMASVLGERVGETVGFRIRDEARVGRTTRIEVVTEGILTRRLQGDPELAGVALVMFDEFHERSIHADLGLALCREVQALRGDLRLLVASATLDTAPVVEWLRATLVESAGRAWPVDIEHRPARDGQRIEDAVAGAVRHALAHDDGSVLAFLPGEGEIRRCAQRLDSLPQGVELHPLYGRLEPAAQQRAIAAPEAGRRKVVLATAVAETSLTIDGVRVVIDGGLSRRARFNPNSGFSELVTVAVSRAAAEQRAGRAGRTAPGRCYRLWSSGKTLDPAFPAEIAEADLAPLALELAAWGSEPDWLDPPPAAHLAQARDLLHRLGALDTAGRITPAGRQMVALGAHPRIARMLLRGAEMGQGALACDLAALIESRLRGAEPDLHRRWLAWRRGGRELTRAERDKLEREASRWRQRLRVSQDEDDAAFGHLLMLAFPDRIGAARGAARFLLVNGRGVRCEAQDSLAGAAFIVVADSGAGADGRVRLAAEVDEAAIRAEFADAIEDRTCITWDSRQACVRALREERLGAVVLDERRLEAPDAEAMADAMQDGLRERGLAGLPWTSELQQLRARVALLARLEPGAWPALDDAALAADGSWLRPWLYGRTRLEQVSADDLAQALRAQLDRGQAARLDEWAPSRLRLPDGRRQTLDYTQGDAPVLAIRLQDLFGVTETPAVADGRVPVQVHLLSPARRPLAVTQDLASFWKNAYPQVRKEMRGRYPKHPWPENPV